MQIFYLSLIKTLQRSRTVDTGKNSHPLLAFANFLWIPSADSRVNKFAEESTRVWQSFPLKLILILVFLCLFEGITGSILPENPLESPINPGRSYFKGRYRGVGVGVAIFDFCL